MALPVAAVTLGTAAMIELGVRLPQDRANANERQEAINMLPPSPSVVHNETTEPLPELQPQTDTKPKTETRPFAEPAVKPKVDDLPIAPPKGEIAVRPKETPTIPKVDTPKLDLPDVPKGVPQTPKSEPPKFDPTRLIPPAIGATTATVGKIAADAVNGTNKTLDIQQVKYGSTELSQAAIQYRKDNNIKGGQNIAVFKYLDKEGKMKLKVLESHDNVHSERWLDRWREVQGLPPENVKEIYTEREPCRPPMPQDCGKLLKETYSHAKISYSFEYGKSKESRKQGTKELKKAVKEIF